MVQPWLLTLSLAAGGAWQHALVREPSTVRRWCVVGTIVGGIGIPFASLRTGAEGFGAVMAIGQALQALLFGIGAMVWWLQKRYALGTD